MWLRASDHAAVLSARPIGSIRSGETSSMFIVSKTPSATREPEPPDTTGRPAGRLEEGGGALDADSQLFATGLEEWIQDLTPLEALQQVIGFLCGQAALPLNVLPEAAGADRQVTGEHGNPVLEDVDVGHFVADVHQA